MPMNPSEWARANKIFHRAVLLPETARRAFIVRECAGDAELCAEVESLVQCHRDGTLSRGPEIPAGTRIGVYEITGFIDAGGMGEVYRAKDTRLKRDVALKILPESFATDPDRLARFQREAEVLASLNHPHIAAIYGIEESDSVRALVMELVEGEDLSQRIARGPISIDEALPIARQIAEALEAAHEQGIVHRDLKPANIKVRPDGTVKVLDFGLAKLTETGASGPSGGDATLSPTMTSPAMITGVGVLLGTAAYMSPEQAKGKPADKRSDIWAFGCVLYEMLSDQRAFKGDDISDTLAAILRQDIDWTALPASTPASVRGLIARCLDRDVRRRLRDIGEARIVLSDPAPAEGAVGGVPALAPSQPLWRRTIPVVLSAIVAGVLASAATVYLTPSQAPLVVTRFPFTLGEGQSITGAPNRQVAISPDGTQMAYTANQRLFLRSMSELEARPIAGTDTGVTGPVFSPDSRLVAFWSSADQTLKKVAVSGGAAVTICRADSPLGMSWGTDGIVFGQPNKGIMRVSANGGSPEMLVSVKDGEEAYGPQILPGGETVLFTLATGTAAERWDKAQIVTQSLRSGERKTLVDGGSDGRYVPTGHLVYAIAGVVFALPMDLRRLEVTGGPVPIVEGLRRTGGNITGAAQFDFSDTGSLVYLPGSISATAFQSDLALIDRKGGVEPLKLPPGPYQHPRAAPNGTQIAFATDDGKEAIVWIYELGRTTSMRRLTFGGKNRFPIWSADGQRVAFQSDREGDLGIFWQPADGSGAAERLTKPEQGTSHVPESWSPKGERFLFGVTKGSSVSLWTFSLLDRKATPFADVQSRSPTNAAFSPDGRWVAYTVTEGVAGIYVQPFPATGAKYLLSKSTTVSPVWSRDGREIVSQPQGGQQAVQTITTQPSFSFSPPVLMRRGHMDFGFTSERNYDVMPDGRILGVVAAGQTESAGSTTRQIQVVLNWFEELKRLVPTK
jgi:Tol biopolymer transport system component